jgi:hypothetical protein
VQGVEKNISVKEREMTRGWRKLHAKKLENLCAISSSDIIWMITSRVK